MNDTVVWDAYGIIIMVSTCNLLEQVESSQNLQRDVAGVVQALVVEERSGAGGNMVVAGHSVRHYQHHQCPVDSNRWSCTLHVIVTLSLSNWPAEYHYSNQREFNETLSLV